jgi:hypothetical protein
MSETLTQVIAGIIAVVFIIIAIWAMITVVM